jgi:hypothetical protein
MYTIFYQLANKTRNLLHICSTITYVNIYIIYGERAIIGFVGLVVNLLNRPTHRATVSVRKSASEKELLFVCLST